MFSTLNTLVLAYIQFMAFVGNTPSEQIYIEKMPAIFAECVTKVENGKVIVVGAGELLNQLRNARTYAFPWTVEILDLLVDKENQTAAVRFTWNSDQVGLHITTAILKFDEAGKIVEINEVYNKFSDITH